MALKDELIQYLDAGYPILYINSFEEIKTDKIIRTAIGKRKAWEWNGSVGLCRFYEGGEYYASKSPLTSCLADTSLLTALQFLTSDNSELDRRLLILKDAVPYFDDPAVVAQMKYICQKIEAGELDTGIVIVASVLKIPKELEKFVTILEHEYLTEKEILSEIEQFEKDYLLSEAEFHDSISENLKEKMVVAFKGLTEFEIENLLASSISHYGKFTDESIDLVLEQKRQMIMKSNILEMIQVKEKPDDIGGLENLKKWLELKSKVFRQINKAEEFGVDMPKGVLIAGVPGCGKSLAVKAASAMFKVPLLRLDIGRIMGMYVGESETNMRNAIKLAEAISPCVLWVDELEKAFAGAGGSGHEVTIRLFGMLLTWLQEKTSPVFVASTANDISKLPPELLRKGRFNDIFYVDLPEASEREKILEIHIKKRRKDDLKNIDIRKIASQTEHYSGADLESLISESVETAFADDRPCITTDLVLDVIKHTKSTYDTMKDKIESMKKFYSSSHFKNASL